MLRFNVVYYMLIIMGIILQYIFAPSTERIIEIAITAFTAIVSVGGYFVAKGKKIYGKVSLGIGCAFFTLVNLFTPGSEVMLLLIPFCTVALLISERNMISIMLTLWMGNAIARAILLFFREETTLIQYKNYMWIVFICFTFGVALCMVNNEFGIYYSREIKSMELNEQRHEEMES